MHPQDSPPNLENQFGVDSSAFISEVIPNSTIRLLRAKPETEETLARQLDISRRLELLRRQAPTHLTASRLLQDDAEVGTTSDGASVHLVLTVVVKPGQWSGSWFIVTVPSNENGAWRAYLTGVREQFVREAGQRAETQP
jgi:hypothetical protein